MIEFVIVAIPLVFMGLGAVELSRWLLVRQTVGYALLEAARAGSVSGAYPQSITAAFQRALIPLHGNVDAHTTAAQAEDQVRQTMVRFQQEFSLPMWRIDMLNPGAHSFDDFADTALTRAAGQRVIDNSYQRERHEDNDLGRYAQGMGPRSHQTLYAANVLTLRLSYLHRPMLPGLGALIRTLSGASGDDYLRRAREDAGLLVIAREISIPMQSNAVEYLRENETTLPTPGR